MYVFRGRGNVLPIYQPRAGVCVLRERRLHSWICRQRRTTTMLSALYQRSGYATAYAPDPLLPVPAFVSTALEEEARRMAKRESKRMKRSASRSSAETQNTTTSPQSVNNNTQPKRIMSIDARLREIMGDVLSEEQLQTKFTFGRLLGSGATSKVYAALENATGQQVAIKVFDKATMIDVRRSMVADGEFVQEKAVRRVQRRLLKIVSELEICRSLDHPNIIKYLGAYETSHRLCIVHELVDGCDLLEHLLTHGKMDEDQAASVFRQLLLALEYCHSHDIYHRDLKLENVLITKDLQVKLIDFGLSEIVLPGQTLKTICGTPLYCSPEILFMHSSSRETGFQGGPADVWSIGILIFALLTGCAPFDDSSFVRLREDVHRNRIAYPSYLSNQVKGLLKLLLIFDPLLRPTVSDILGYEWIRKASSSVIPVERAESPRPQCLSPSHKRAEHRSLSDNCTDTTASTSGSFEGDTRNLHKITEEPHDHSEITLPTHLSCLERDLEHLMSVKH